MINLSQVTQLQIQSVRAYVQNLHQPKTRGCPAQAKIWCPFTSTFFKLSHPTEGMVELSAGACSNCR